MSLPRRTRPRLLCVSLLLACTLACGSVYAGNNEDARAQNASRVLRDIQAIPESAIPDKLFDDARAIVVVPDTIKAGLLVGGRRGHGVMAVKTAEGTWSNPSFIKLTGGSIGLQAGVQSSDVVLVFRSDRGLDSIVNGKFTLGADAGVAAGPLGRNAATATDGELKAEIWSWSRARGLFAGVALDGAVLSIDYPANEATYGRDVTPRMIFEGRNTAAPSDAVVAFRDSLEEATAAARARRGETSAPATAATPATQPAAATTATTPAATPASTSETQTQPQPQPFQPVENANNPAKVEPLPATR